MLLLPCNHLKKGEGEPDTRTSISGEMLFSRRCKHCHIIKKKIHILVGIECGLIRAFIPSDVLSLYQLLSFTITLVMQPPCHVPSPGHAANVPSAHLPPPCTHSGGTDRGQGHVGKLPCVQMSFLCLCKPCSPGILEQTFPLGQLARS